MEVPEEIQRAYPEHQWRIGYGPEANFLVVQQEAEDRGLIGLTRIGRAVVRCFDARTIVNLYEDLLRENSYRLFEVEGHSFEQQSSAQG